MPGLQVAMKGIVMLFYAGGTCSLQSIVCGTRTA